MFSFDYLEHIKKEVDEKIIQERKQYDTYYSSIDEYVSTYTIKENCVMIGGRIGIDLLLEKKRGIGDFTYDLYSENAFIHANNLCNFLEIHNLKDDIIFLKTVIPSIKYTIFINMRPIVFIYTISINSFKLIAPIKVKTFDKKYSVLVLSPEIQLIDIYRILYSPQRVDEWKDILVDERRLFKFLHQRIYSQEIKGGDENESKNEENESEKENEENENENESKNIEITLNDRKKIQFLLMKYFVSNNPHIVLIGEHAFKIISKNNESLLTMIIQVISENDPEIDLKEIEKIIHKDFPSFPLSKLTRELHIMQDFRIRRTTIKISSKEIMYIYNAAHYDLIPFNNIYHNMMKIQLGNIFVILRFLLLDFWMIRWILESGSINELYAKQRLQSILNKLLFLRKQIQKSFKKFSINPILFDGKGLLKIFTSNPKEYLGIYEDEVISQKIMIKQLPKKFYDYYPREYKSKNNNYRLINN